MSPSWELFGSAYAGAYWAMSCTSLCVPYMAHPHLRHRLSFLDYGFVISGAALEMLMGSYYLTYLICGIAIFPLMERSCPFIFAWNRTKSITCKPKLNLWMGKMQAELICGSTEFYDYFSVHWWRVRTLTAVVLNWGSKFVISFSEKLNASFLPRQFSNREEIRESEKGHILNRSRFNYKNPTSSQWEAAYM